MNTQFFVNKEQFTFYMYHLITTTFTMVLRKRFTNFVPKSTHRPYIFKYYTIFYRGKVLIQFIALFLLILRWIFFFPPHLVLLMLITRFSSFLIRENLALVHHLFHSEVLVFSFPDGLNKRKRLNDLT